MCVGNGARCIRRYGERYWEACNRQQLGWTEEYIMIVSCLQLKMTVMEGGLDAPGARRTVGS